MRKTAAVLTAAFKHQLKTAGFRDLAERERLPYRTTAEAMLLDENGNVVARKEPHYIMFPGGGVDDGEDPKAALLREIREETGLDASDVTLRQRVKWDWPDAWPKTEKQRKRCGEFRGEDSFIFTGNVKGRGKQTSAEGDSWGNVSSMPLDEIEKAYAIDHGELAPYKSAQLRALLALRKLTSGVQNTTPRS
jgi:putative (di)nucleoside polyphosphate hydrolase